MKNEIVIAENLAIKAGQEALRSLRKGIRVSYKVDGTPVSDADIRLNEMIVSGLRREFPSDGIISEELEEVNGERRWYVDPIDGTREFVSGEDEFAVHIGMCENGSPVLGVVYQPKRDILYSAFVGVKPSQKKQDGNVRILNLEEAIGRRPIAVVSRKEAEHEQWLQRAGVDYTIRSGSEGLRIMKIADDYADIHISSSRCGSWDVCAPHAILLSAGGVASYSDGRDITYGSERKMKDRIVFARNRNLLELAVAAINKN